MRLQARLGMAAGIFLALLCLLPLLSAQLLDDRFSGNIGQASPEELSNTALIKVATDNSTVHAQLSFVNVSYYKKRLTENFPQSPDELYKPGDYTDEEFSFDVLPLNNSSLRFTFDGHEVTDSGGDPACLERTGDDGWTSCNILYYYDEAAGEVRSFFDPVDGPKGCGEVGIEYAGETRGSQLIKPAYQSVTLCPPHSPALSAFHTSLSGGIKSNFWACFPAIAIMGLLLASMYYSGRDPLSLFDITTPRLPKTKPFKVTAGTAPMMLRAATKKLISDRQQARIDVKRLTNAYLDTYLSLKYDEGKKNLYTRFKNAREKRRIRDEMRKELNKLLREHKLLMEKIVSDEKFDKNEMYVETQALILKFEKFFSKYSPESLGFRDEIVQKWGAVGRKRYEDLKKAYGMTQQELASKLSMAMYYNTTKKMFGARSRPGGRGKKILDAVFDKVTDWEFEADRKISKVRIPMVGRLVRWGVSIPYRYASRAFDAVAQHRASSLALWSLVRDLNGAAWYRLGHNSKGKANALGKLQEKIYSSSPFGKAYAWYHKKKSGADVWKEYVARYNLNDKKGIKFPTDTIENSMVEDERLLRINLYNAHMALQLGMVLANPPYEEKKRNEIEGIANSKDLSAYEKLSKIIAKMDSRDLKTLGIVSDAEKAAYLGRLKGFTEYVENDLLADKKKGRYYARSEHTILDDMMSDYALLDQEKAIEEVRKNPALMAQIRTQAEEQLKQKYGWVEKQKAGKTPKPLKEKEILELMDKIVKCTPLEAQKGLAKQNLASYKVQYEKMAEALSKEIDNKYPGMKFQEQLTGFAKQQNDRIRQLADKEQDPAAARALRLIVVGKHPAAAYLTEMLRGVLFDKNGNLRQPKTPGAQEHQLWVAGKRIAHADDFELPDIMEFEALFAKGEGKYRFRKLLSDIMRDHADEPEVKALLKAIANENEVMARGMDDKTLKAHKKISLMLSEQGESMDVDLAMNTMFLKSLDQTFRLGALLKRAADAEEGEAKLSPTLAGELKWIKEKVALEQASENAATRQSSKTNEYRHLGGLGQSIEMLIDANLRATKVVGYAMNVNVKGGYWSESAFAAMSSDFRDVAQQYNGMKAIFLNKIKKGGALYDEKFANDVRQALGGQQALDNAIKNEAMPFKGYQALLKRGLTFSDLKHIPYLATGDGKGCIPILHSDQKLLDELYKDDLLKKNGVFKRGVIIEAPKVLDSKGRVLRDATEEDINNAKQLAKLGLRVEHDVRDYSSILADRIVASRYSNLPLGMVLEIKDSDGKWIMVDPSNPKSRNALIAMFAEAANTNPNLKGSLARSLAGFDENGNFNPAYQQIRVISSKDYGYEEGKSTRRHPILEWVHAGTYDRAEKMNEWYAVQGVLRQVVSQYAEKAKGWTVVGPQRFKIDKDVFGKEGEKKNAIQVYLNEQYENAVKEYVDKERANFKLINRANYGSATLLNEAADQHVNSKAVQEEAAKHASRFSYAYGKLAEQAPLEQNRFRLTMRNLKSEVAGRMLTEIAEAESVAIAAKYMKKAIRNTSADDLGLSKQEYRELREKIDSARSDYKMERRVARQDFKTLNDVVVSWTGSHNFEADYGSKRNLLTRSWLVQNLIDRGAGHPYTLGTAKDFWYAVESTTMRSSSSVMGQRFGFGAIISVALETGQGAYEPAHMWLQSGLWEKHYIPFVAATRIIHMATIPFFTSIYRGMHGVPSYSRKNEWEGIDMVRHQPYGSLLARGLLRMHQVSDYILDTKKNIEDYVGVSALRKAIIDSKVGSRGEGGVRDWMENRYISSSHISGDAISPRLLRLLDKGKYFDEKTTKALYADSDRQAMNFIQNWAKEADEKKREKERKALEDYIDGVKSQEYFELKHQTRLNKMLGFLEGPGSLLDIGDALHQKREELKTADKGMKKVIESQIEDLEKDYGTISRLLGNEFRFRSRINTRTLFDDFLKAEEGSNEEAVLAKELQGKLPKDLLDMRPELVKTARGAGRDFFIDGSRNRFMNLWLPHHENIWRWIVPDLTELDPRGYQNYGPMQANIVRGADAGTASNLWVAGGLTTKYNEKTGETTYEGYDPLNLKGESFRHIYKKGENALFHLLDYQSQMLSYSGANPYLQFAGNAMPKFLGVSADWLKWKVGGKAKSQSPYIDLVYGNALGYTQTFGSTPEELVASIEHRARRRDEQSRLMPLPLDYYQEKVLYGMSEMDFDNRDHIYWYERGSERVGERHKKIADWCKNVVVSGLESVNMMRQESDYSKARNTLGKQESFKNMAIYNRMLTEAEKSSLLEGEPSQ